MRALVAFVLIISVSMVCAYTTESYDTGGTGRYTTGRGSTSRYWTGTGSRGYGTTHGPTRSGRTKRHNYGSTQTPRYYSTYHGYTGGTGGTGRPYGYTGGSTRGYTSRHKPKVGIPRRSGYPALGLTRLTLANQGLP
ncbi:unnamed protein product, partial [Medioppia subpectinata]